MTARKIFGTDGIRGTANQGNVTPEMAMRLGMAAATYFRRSDPRRHLVVIGKDTRLSGYMLENALTAGFTSTGVNVLLLGPPGTGKSHVAKALALLAVGRGYKVLYREAHHLIEDLHEARELGELAGPVVGEQRAEGGEEGAGRLAPPRRGDGRRCRGRNPGRTDAGCSPLQ